MLRLAAAAALLATAAAAGPATKPADRSTTTRPAVTRPVADTFLRNGVTAHRGASHAFPENTMRAFRGAIELGVDWVELDVFLTKDGQVVVSHDPTTGRVA
ncbi:glycerophosphodiester phosphodiesterase, partial [bacterium]